MLKIIFLLSLLQISFLVHGQEGISKESSVDAPKVHPLIQIQKLGYSEINLKALNDQRVQIILDKALRDGLMAEIPPEFFHKAIMEKVKGTPIEFLFKKFPAVLDKSILILRDKNAFPDLLKIFTKKEELKNYMTYWVIILVITLWLNKTLLSKKARWNPLQRFLVRMGVSVGSLSASIYIFYSIFQNELSSSMKLLGFN